jgi:hypothetical protein
MVEMVNLASAWLPGRHGHHLPPRVRSAIQIRVANERWDGRQRWLVPLFLVGVLAAMVGVQAAANALEDKVKGVGWVALVLVSVSPTLAVFLAGWHLAGARQRRAAAEAIAGEGLCPGCLYKLSDLPEEADGCRVCPECGGAWRVPETGPGPGGAPEPGPGEERGTP